jgi:hypothetical protein
LNMLFQLIVVVLSKPNMFLTVVVLRQIWLSWSGNSKIILWGITTQSYRKLLFSDGGEMRSCYSGVSTCDGEHNFRVSSLCGCQIILT